MKPLEMDKLIEIHLAAEKAADTARAVSVYTDDVEHDVVGSPGGYYGEDFCVIEHMWTGTVPGNFLGVPGHGRRISHRLLHVWEFRDGRISRENVWIDSGSAIAQLTASADPASHRA
jgi:predicted ester cyclase